MEPLSIEEQVAASAVASLGAGFHKRARDDTEAVSDAKNSRTEDPPKTPPAKDQPEESRVLKAYPFFYYQDFSSFKDPDPLTPPTAPGRVPNFPAKMHSILSRPDLADIVCWMPHGRSWRVLKPREFEIKVIPTYFEHAKFSSFIRQANGWGFRRVTQGRDRNSYYHELFLRGLPHLCKQMRRPGVAQKLAADPEQEPDLYKISQAHPVPDKAEDEDSILLKCTLQGGPKARMPIYSAGLRHNSSLKPLETDKSPKSAGSPTLTPRDQQAISAFQQSLGASEGQFKPTGNPTAACANVAILPQAFYSPPPAATSPLPVNNMAALIAANQLAFQQPNLIAASQFAAGFAAATAWSQQQFQTMMGQFAQQQQMQQQDGTMPQPVQQVQSQAGPQQMPVQQMTQQTQQQHVQQVQEMQQVSQQTQHVQQVQEMQQHVSQPGQHVQQVQEMQHVSQPGQHVQQQMQLPPALDDPLPEDNTDYEQQDKEHQELMLQELPPDLHPTPLSQMRGDVDLTF